MSLSVRGALLWSFAERYASLAIAIASTMMLSRLLTPVQVGVYSLCASVAAVAGILRDFGVSEYLIQERELSREKLRAAFGVAIVVAWSVGALIFFSRNAIAEFYAEPGVALVLGVLTLNFIALPFASPAYALLSREMAFRKLFTVQIASNTAQAITSVVLAWRGHGFMSLAWGTIASVVCQSILLTIIRPSDSLLAPSLRGTSTIIRYGSMFVASRVIETLTRNAHEPIIAKQFDFASVGMFSRAFGLLELFNANIAAAIIRVATPAFASDHRAGLPLASSFARGTAIFTSLSWPFYGFVALAAHEIIQFLFGAQWDAAAPIATILAIAVLPNGLVNLAPNLMAATGHVKKRLSITLTYAPVHILSMGLASLVNLETMAAVFALSNLFMVYLYLRQLRLILNTSIKSLLMPCLGSAQIACSSVLLQAIALYSSKALQLPTLICILITLSAGVVGWLFSGKLLSHPAHTEIIRLLKNIGKKAY